MQSIPEDPILKFHSDTMEVIRKIYNLDGPGRIEEAVNILDEWCKKQTHFQKKDFGIPYLEKKLIACKSSVEKAKIQIDKLCTMRTLLPHFFVDYVKTDLKAANELFSSIPLPKMTKDYYRVCLNYFTGLDYSAESFTAYYKHNIIMSEYLKQHDYVNGYIIIGDYRSLNLMEVMRKINITEFQQFMTILIDGYGVRLLGLHILTESAGVDIFLKFIKQFLSAKIAGRFHIHTTVESLYEIIDKEILPVEYGGSERSMYKLQEDWIDVLSSGVFVEYMKMMNKAGTDEKYRQIDKYNDQYMGTPGTFRNLNVD